MSDFTVNTALILIDVQQGFDDPILGNRNNKDAEKNIKSLLDKWRDTNQPVIFVQHKSVFENSPLHPSKPGYAIKEIVKPRKEEVLFVKQVHSAFIGTELEQYLRDCHIQNLILVGFTTDHCVSTTTRMGYDLGFNMTLISDATATFDRVAPDQKIYSAELIHETALASLHQEFANILDTQSLMKADF